MPSTALTVWTADRTACLAEVDGQAAASAAAVPPNPRLVDENLRGYAVLMSAHFQGFCRDLYTESALVIVSKVRRSLREHVQNQYLAGRRLDHGNPTAENIGEDFRRFGVEVDKAVKRDPASGPRLADLGALVKWRNAAAHRGDAPKGGVPLTLANLRRWRTSCDGLAAALDGVMYNQLRRVLRRPPW